jgi:putative flippase GtrA
VSEELKAGNAPENEKNFFRSIRRLVIKYLDKYRFLRFAIIGGMGVPINLGLLAALNKGIGLNYEASVILATEISMSINYLLNNYWTFNNRKINKLKGWARYALISLPFDGTSFALTVTLKHTALKNNHWGWLLAAGAGLFLAMILRYVVVKRFVWRGHSHPEDTA